MFDTIPCFTKINFTELRAKNEIPKKPTMLQRKSMARQLVEAGMTIREACKSAHISTRDYYEQKKALPK